MTDTAIPVTIDRAHCSGCGLCLNVCSHRAITLSKGTAAITGATCSLCGHCAAACPDGVIAVAPLDTETTAFKTFTARRRWLPFGAFDTPGLVNLMQSRRSCRNFKPRPVPVEILEDLIKIGISAPSGTNCQPWVFTVFSNRKALYDLGTRIAHFYRRMNKLASNTWLRTGLKALGKPALAGYYNNHFESVTEALHLWEAEGRDLLFHGAQAGILVGADRQASCPVEDALLATQNILLAARALGIGSTLTTIHRRHNAEVKALLGVPDAYDVAALIPLGYPLGKFGSGPRRPLDEVIYSERWGQPPVWSE